MKRYPMDIVLSPESMEFIKEKKPEIHRILSFFDQEFDRSCYLLVKAVEVFNLELATDDGFRRDYEEKFAASESSV